MWETGESEHAVKTIKEGGNIVTIAGPATPPTIFFAMISDGGILENLRPFIESGKVKALLDPKSPFPFSESKQAFAHLETNRATGTVLIYPIP